MSNIAKQRLLAVGARFSSYEHENAIKDESRSNGKANIKNQHAVSSNKMSFWKKTSGKIPGRPVYGAQHPPLQATDAHLSTYIRSGKSNRASSDNSFQEFEGSTMDAWDEKEDDSIRGVNPEGSVSPVEYSLSDLAVESADSNIEDESLSRPPLQNVSSDSLARHPAPAGREIEFGRSLSNTKQNFVSKLSEKLGKSNKARESGATSESSDFIHPPEPPSPIRQMKLDLDDQESSRMERFGKLIAGPVTDLDQLRKLSWNGIPRSLRPMVWRLLSGYLPPSIDRRQATHERKQREYHGFVEKYYHTRHEDEHHETYRQIHIDIPRTNPLIPIFQQRVVQELFERILFIWAIRHPASGYVQGINDLVVPFFIVFLSEFTDKEIETCNIEKISKEALDSVEADSFWCLSKLLDGIQDNYTFAQPGIQMKINALKELVSRINDRLHKHIVNEHIDYLQFTFRWMNNLLMRELPLRCSIRLWDTYWSEPDGFAVFHLYVCAALLTLLSKEILEKSDFQSLMTFLQNIPSRDWNDDDVSCLVAEAYRLMYVFAGAPKHLR